VTNISTVIAILLHHGRAMSSLSRPIVTSNAVSTEDAHVLRSFYQRWVPTPLRAAARVPSPLMAARRWGDVSYKHVPSKCMHINGKHFIKHDTEQFEAYLDSVAEGKAKISGVTLLPHELLAKALAPLNFEYREGKPSKPSLGSALRARNAKREVQVIDAQWDAMIARLCSAGTLDNCLALCDVSGSMGEALRTGDAIARAYAEAGYDVPKILYWNLASRLEAVPVEAEWKGVALMSGFSPAMMKMFMGDDADAEEETMDDDMVMVDERDQADSAEAGDDTLSIMKKALGMASYDKLVVLD